MKKYIVRLPKNIYKKLTEEIYDGICFITPQRKIIFWNKQAERITGYRKKEALLKHCYENILQHMDKNGRKLCLTKYCLLATSIKKNKLCSGRVYLRRKDRVRIPVDVNVTPICYQGKMMGVVEVFRDASLYERMAQQRNVAKKLSLRDALTGLPNRRYLNKKLSQEIKKFKQSHNDLHSAVLDIDHFKSINDNFGHKTGDVILREVASILENNLRTSDFIGRYGGDEFVVILPNTPKEYSFIVFERIRKIITDKKIGKKIFVTVSFGVTKAKSKDTPDTIFKRADSALYRAKNNGRNRIEYI